MTDTPRYVTVSVPRTPLKNLTYSIPESFPDIAPGMRVLVPIGSRFVTAFVVSNDPPETDVEVKPVADLIDPQSLFSPELLRLTRWMGDYYLAEWGDVRNPRYRPGWKFAPKPSSSSPRVASSKRKAIRSCRHCRAETGCL